MSDNRKTIDVTLTPSGQGKVNVQGQDISNAVGELAIFASAGTAPTMRLALIIFDEIKATGECETIIPETTRAALIALGWTPPEESKKYTSGDGERGPGVQDEELF